MLLVSGKTIYGELKSVIVNTKNKTLDVNDVEQLNAWYDIVSFDSIFEIRDNKDFNLSYFCEVEALKLKRVTK